MNHNPHYDKALAFATEKHKGQFRTDGDTPYIEHPIRVASRAHNDIQQVIALLHDTIEDTQTTFEEILYNFGPEVAMAVEDLTHRKGEFYVQYIERVAQNPNAVAVKILDICDNLSDAPSPNARKKGLIGLTRLFTTLPS